MDAFAGGWTTFEHVPMVTDTCNDSFANPSNQTADMQNPEWTGFLNSLDHENSASELGGFLDFNNSTQCRPAATAKTSGVSHEVHFPGSSPSTSSMISPPQTATQPGFTWLGTSGPTLQYPPALHPENWRPAQLLDHQHHVNNFGHQGLCIQMPLTPQTAGFHQRANLDQTLLQDSPYSHDDEQGINDLTYLADHRSTILIEECAGDDGDDEADAADPCYAQLLYRCLRETPDHTMSLKELYEWIAQHSQKAKDPKSRGWQNSVRHNLSMNAAFEKASASAYQGAKKGSLWRLTEKALREGVISTTRYRKDPKRKHERKSGMPALKRQLSGARGGQATRAASRRNRELHQARSAPYPAASGRHYRHERGLDSGFASPLSVHSERASPMSNMLPTSEPASPFSFFRQDPEYHFGLPPNPHTPPQLQLRYDTPAKPALEKFELQHIDYSNGNLFGDYDDFVSATPSLATEASCMSDDGMESLFSPIARSRETTIF